MSAKGETMIIKRRWFTTILFLVIVSMLLIGCAGSGTPAAVESIVSTPEANQSSTSPQPTPTPAPPSAFALPTPSSSDVAVVGGILLRGPYNGDIQPGSDSTLRLARVIRSDDGTPLMASAGEKSSPTTITDQQGGFAFVDVPPNTYGLVLVTPLGSFLLKDQTGDEFLIDVEPGEVLDLGEVQTDIAY